MPDHTASEVSSLRLDDDAFLAAFERGGFKGDEFPHKAHIRMAWLYVTRLGPEGAIGPVAGGIQNLARANGQTTLYHDTVTRAWVYLVADAVTKSPSAGFEEFMERNPRLADKRLLLEFYSPDVLSSSQARATWIASDLAPIPGAPESSVAAGEADVTLTVAAGEADVTLTVAADDYLAAFASVPTAVAIIAATDGVALHGMTASSVTSLSMDPPLVLICVRGGSRILPLIRSSKHFSISFLNDQQGDLARHFASAERPAGAVQFHGIPHRAGPSGLPILNEASAWLACDLWCEYRGGDHAIVCGVVREAFGGTAHPLLSYARQLL